MGVGPEVAGALALGPAHHLGPRELLAHGDREVRVGLVVAVLDVEARVELLDPGVLELQGLDLVGDHGPLDAGRGGDHGRRARVQRADVLEVGRQPGPQRLGLADVDDPAAACRGTGRPPRRRGSPPARAVGRRVSHTPTLWSAHRRRGRAAYRGYRWSRQVTVEVVSPLDRHGLLRQGLGGRPCLTAPVAMSKALPWQAQLMVPPDDVGDDAGLVGAHGGERLEAAGAGLGDDDLLVREDLAAADRDGGLGDGLLDRAGRARPPRAASRRLPRAAAGEGHAHADGTDRTERPPEASTVRRQGPAVGGRSPGRSWVMEWAFRSGLPAVTAGPRLSMPRASGRFL